VGTSAGDFAVGQGLLELGDASVGDEGVKKLQQALPNCTIVR